MWPCPDRAPAEAGGGASTPRAPPPGTSRSERSPNVRGRPAWSPRASVARAPPAPFRRDQPSLQQEIDRGLAERGAPDRLDFRPRHRLKLRHDRQRLQGCPFERVLHAGTLPRPGPGSPAPTRSLGGLALSAAPKAKPQPGRKIDTRGRARPARAAGGCPGAGWRPDTRAAGFSRWRPGGQPCPGCRRRPPAPPSWCAGSPPAARSGRRPGTPPACCPGSA